jgi:glycosyltransferase involved in cell wall biosynthesis
VTLDLASELAAQRVDVAVAALGQPTRAAFPEPQIFFDLSRVSYNAATCAEAVARVAMDFGADLVHAHLLSADEMRAIRASGFPLVVTLHNMPEAWPVGIRDGGSPVADLILACSRAVSEQAEAARLGAPVRTVWNGIDPSSVATSEHGKRCGVDWRKRLGWVRTISFSWCSPTRGGRSGSSDCRQFSSRCRSALERGACGCCSLAKPARAAATRRKPSDAGQRPSSSVHCARSIHAAGALHAIGDALATGDVLLAVSAFEGLSLAQLEALAAGLPVVATTVGGAREIAAHTTALKLVPSAAKDDHVVAALAEIATLRSGSRSRFREVSPVVKWPRGRVGSIRRSSGRAARRARGSG